MAIQTMQSLNYIATNDFTSNTIQIGSAIEIILLAIAVGNKILFYKEEAIQANIRERQILQEKESLKSGQKEKLEIEFQRQTEVLYDKIRELRRQNIEINKKFREISSHNAKLIDYHELLEQKNKIIIRQNNVLKKHREDLENIIFERTKELEEAKLLAEEADELKTAFLKNFSHDANLFMTFLLSSYSMF